MTQPAAPAALGANWSPPPVGAASLLREPDATEDGGLTMPAAPDWLHLVLAALGAFVIGFLLAVIWTWRH